MKFTVKKPEPMDMSGILYLVHFKIEDLDLVKIGVTTRTIEERVAEILVSIFKRYREFPYCRPKRFRTTENVYEKEATLHQYFEPHKHTFTKKFSGSTEFFNIPLDNAVVVYEDLLAGKDINASVLQKS